MPQNWLKPIKGHNGPVPALNVIPEFGRNRVKGTLVHEHERLAMLLII